MAGNWAHHDLKFGSAPRPAKGASGRGRLGVSPGITGMQPVGYHYVITGVGEPLSGRLFLFDALNFETKTIRIRRRDDNPLNRKNPDIAQPLTMKCSAA